VNHLAIKESVVAGTQKSKLETALKRLPKPELVKRLMDLAGESPELRQQLESNLDVELSTDHLIEEARRAIDKATYVPEREINRNFAYDYAAYRRVAWCLTQLACRGELHAAMELGERLYSKGGHQVEMSDEGQMSYDIAEQMKIVFDALSDSKVPIGGQLKWAWRIESADRTGFPCSDLLSAFWNREFPKHDLSEMADFLLEQIAVHDRSLKRGNGNFRRHRAAELAANMLTAAGRLSEAQQIDVER
jgi:hypothetical protein